MTGGQYARSDPPLNLCREIQQPDRVGDLGPAAADPPSEFLVRGPELLQQLLVRGRLFQRVQVRPVDVLQQRVPQHRIVAGVPDDRRDDLPADRLRRAPPPLAHDELVLIAVEAPYDDRLEKADLLDRGLQLLQCLLVEDLPGLLRVGHDRADGDLREVRPGTGASSGPDSIAGSGSNGSGAAGKALSSATCWVASIRLGTSSSAVATPDAGTGAVGINAPRPRPSPPRGRFFMPRLPPNQPT